MPQSGSAESAPAGSTAAEDTAAGRLAHTTALESAAPVWDSAGGVRGDVVAVPPRSAGTTMPGGAWSFCGAPVSSCGHPSGVRRWVNRPGRHTNRAAWGSSRLGLPD